ncbi:sigma 54-interacting transcriptional regulator, partial [Bacillus mycoides]|uniref:sigma 54-interacting transcriptional regulator n=1 Tax=Bacillus mycoides TaxID=1405 RepID=UPI001642D2E6
TQFFPYLQPPFTRPPPQPYNPKFQHPNPPTIFLHQIPQLPPQIQLALLPLLHHPKLTPIPTLKHLPLHIPLITPTHPHLLQLLQEGKFPQDLY